MRDSDGTLANGRLSKTEGKACTWRENTGNGKDTMKLVWVQGDNMGGGEGWCLQKKVGWDLECKPGVSDFSSRQGHWRL